MPVFSLVAQSRACGVALGSPEEQLGGLTGSITFSAHLRVLVDVVQVRRVRDRERVDVDAHLRRLHALRHIYRVWRRVCALIAICFIELTS